MQRQLIVKSQPKIILWGLAFDFPTWLLLSTDTCSGPRGRAHVAGEIHHQGPRLDATALLVEKPLVGVLGLQVHEMLAGVRRQLPNAHRDNRLHYEVNPPLQMSRDIGALERAYRSDCVALRCEV